MEVSNKVQWQHWMRLVSVAIFGFLTLLAPLSGASDVLPANPDPEFLRRIWQVEDGLPSPAVRAVYQSHNGYLWLATDESLSRFDGIRFVAFDRKDFRLKNDRWMVGIAEGKDGSIWASGCNGGLIRVREDVVTQYTTNNGLPDNYVLSMCVDREGTVWVGTVKGLAQLRGERFVAMTNSPGAIVEAVRTIVQDRDGGLWVGTAAGLNRYFNGAFTAYTATNLLVNESIYSLHQSRDGALWVGTLAGLSCIDKGELRHYTEADGLQHKTVRSILEDAAGDIWIGTHGGLQRFSRGKFSPIRFKDVSSYEIGQVISDIHIYSLCEDREGNIWAGSSAGLNRFNSQKFKLYTTENGLGDNQATCGIEDRSGSIWIGTFGGGLTRIQGNKIKVFKPGSGFSSKQVLALHEDSEGNIWIGTDGEGLFRYREGKFQQFLAKDDPVANSVRMICDDDSGGLWIGCNRGVYRVKEGVFTRVIPTHSVKVILPDDAGGLWVGSQSDGLTYWVRQETNTVEAARYTSEDGLSSDWVTALYHDDQGALWIGHGLGGLDRLLNGRVTTFNTEDGHFNERISHIQEDHLGNLWLGARNGIFSVRKKDLNDFAAGTIAAVNFIQFGKADGLRRAQCNGIGQPAGWKSAGTRLWFPTLFGAVMFHPEEISNNDLQPPVIIEEVLADGAPWKEWKSGIFPPGKGELEFHFTALSFNMPERLRFKYRLQGYDVNWQDGGTRRTARYTNLRPGNYSFQVVASNEDGVWNETGATFDFLLQPRFTQTYMFYSLCGLAVVAVATGAWRFRIARMKRREKELIGVVNNRTRELQQQVAERELAERRATVFSKLGQRLSLVASQEQAAEIIAGAADELIGWDGCALYSYSNDEDKGRPVAIFDLINGRRENVTARNLFADLSPNARRAIKQGAQLVLRDEALHATTVDANTASRPKDPASLMYVPVRKGEKAVGVLSIQNYKKVAYDANHLQTLQALADYCAGAFERIRAEEALRESQQMVLRQERLAAVGQLSAGVAHEFNNILTIIKGHANLLMDSSGISIDTRQSLGQISTSAERAANLTRQMLAFSRKQIMRATRIDLNEVTTDVTKMLSRLVGEHIALYCNYAPNLQSIHADIGMIEQIIMNLALNARDAMPNGGQLMLSTSAVELSKQQLKDRSEAYAGQFATLTVADTGCGMDDETVARIFEPFFTTKEVGKGTGLGLSTVYGIVKQHHGWIEVVSKKGHGSIFTIYFPVATGTHAEANDKQQSAAVQGGRETILFVEDEPDIRRLARQVLERYGYSVLEAASGVEAVKVWQENKTSVHLLLTDMMMPEGMSGRELAEELRSHNAGLKVIFTSGYSVDMLEKDFGFKNGYIFLPKPYHPQTLAKTIRDCLDKKS